MNSKKIYFGGVLGGLLIAGLVIFLMNFSSAPSIDLSDERFSTWSTALPESTFFHARFPTPPEHRASQLPIVDTDTSIRQDIYVAADEQGNTFYAVSFLYPAPFDADKPETVLQVALDGMLDAAVGGELLESAFTEFQKRPALTFMIQDGQQFIHQGVLFFEDRLLYQVFVSYLEGGLHDDEYLYFLKSFEPKGL